MKKTRIVPAILASSAQDFSRKLKFFQPHFKLIQIDVLDGSMGIKNKSFFGLAAIRKMRSRADFELHLMTDTPERIYREWLGYSRLRRVIVHYESFHKRKLALYDTIKEIRRAKKQIGIAINPNTTISKILEFLPLIDEVLIMGVHPGWSGQTLIPATLQKVSAIRNHYPKIDIGFDGGIDENNVTKLLGAGVNVVCAASMLLHYEGDLKGLKQLVKRITSKQKL